MRPDTAIKSILAASVAAAALLWPASIASAQVAAADWSKVAGRCTAVGDHKPRLAASSEIARTISQKAIDEYYAFGGHEIDADGKMVAFGLVETEQEEDSKGDHKARLGDLGWWHVLKYWRHLTDNPNANAQKGDERDLHSLLRLWVYESASRNNDETQVQSAIGDPWQLSKRVFGAIADLEKKGHAFGDNAIPLPTAHEVLREMSFRSAIADTPWSAAFISYVIGKAKSEAKQEARNFAASAAHVTYIYEAFENALADLGSGATDPLLANPLPLYRACPLQTTRLRVGDMVCYSRQKKVDDNEKATTKDVRAAILRNIEQKKPRGERSIKETHCDIVVGFGSAKRTVFVIGGNVLQSVTVKQLRLDRRTGALKESQPCPPKTDSKDRFGARSEVTKSPLFQSPKCTLNAQPWFVVLQLRG